MGFLRLFPGYRAWQERREAMRELEGMQEREEWEIARSDTNPVNLALVRLELGDKKEAAVKWEEALRRYPNFAKTSHDSLKILVGLGRWEEADRIMLEGQKRFRNDPFYAWAYASVAEYHQDYEEAARRWQRVRKRFPSTWRGWVSGAASLRQLGRLEEADALLVSALKTFSRRPELWMERARIAERQGDWPRAIELWDYTSHEFRFGGAEVGVARALQAMGKPQEAEQRLKDGRMRFPILLDIPLALAQLARDTGNVDDALYWCTFMRNRFALSAVGYQEESRLLRKLGRFAEAEQVLLEAIDRFSGEAWTAAEHAELAAEQRDWPEADRRWAVVRSKFPNRGDGYLRGAEALSALGRDAEAAELRSEYSRRSD